MRPASLTLQPSNTQGPLPAPWTSMSVIPADATGAGRRSGGRRRHRGRPLRSLEAAKRSRDLYQVALQRRGFGSITTEIAPAADFYYAEDYHQQYLAKNPAGYCGIGGTGVSCPTGPAAAGG